MAMETSAKGTEGGRPCQMIRFARSCGVGVRHIRADASGWRQEEESSCTLIYACFPNTDVPYAGRASAPKLLQHCESTSPFLRSRLLPLLLSLILFRND